MEDLLGLAQVACLTKFQLLFTFTSQLPMNAATSENKLCDFIDGVILLDSSLILDFVPRLIKSLHASHSDIKHIFI